MEARSFPALPARRIPTKKPCANKFTLDCLLMEVAGAIVVGRGSFALERSGSPRHSSFTAKEVNWVHGVDHRPSRWFAPIGEIYG
jgi:hypothetical protein